MGGWLDGWDAGKFMRVILFGLMTPYGWHWAERARRPKWERSEWWIWPWVMDSVLMRGQGVWVMPVQCLGHASVRPAMWIGSLWYVAPKVSASVCGINILWSWNSEPGTVLSFVCMWSYLTLSPAPGGNCCYHSSWGRSACSGWCGWSGQSWFVDQDS